MKEHYNDFEILSDWLKNLIERAIKIDTKKEVFNEGLLQGYYECLSHIMNQIDTLDLKEKLKDEYLQDFNPDDLLSGKAQNPFEKKSSNNKTDQCS